MEYETEGESALFDDSTNPSLDPDQEQAPKNASVKRNAPQPADKRQKAEDIPEEEAEAQMS